MENQEQQNLEAQKVNQQNIERDRKIFEKLEKDKKTEVQDKDFKLSESLKSDILNSKKLSDKDKTIALTVLGDKSPANSVQEKIKQAKKTSQNKEKDHSLLKDADKAIDKATVGLKGAVEKAFGRM